MPAPGQVPAPAPANAAPNAFVMAAGDLWWGQIDVWRGDTLAAAGRPAKVTAATGNTFLSWLLPLLANSLLVGLLVVTAATEFGRWLLGSFLYSYSSPTFGEWFRAFLVSSIIFFAFLMLRALAVFLAARVSGAQPTFNESAAALGVGQTLWWLPLLVSTFFLFLIPQMGILFFFLVCLGLPVMSEVTTYIALTRLGRLKRSPLVPYAWFSALAILIMILFFWGITS